MLDSKFQHQPLVKKGSKVNFLIQKKRGRSSSLLVRQNVLLLLYSGMLLNRIYNQCEKNGPICHQHFFCHQDVVIVNNLLTQFRSKKDFFNFIQNFGVQNRNFTFSTSIMKKEWNGIQNNLNKLQYEDLHYLKRRQHIIRTQMFQSEFLMRFLI